MHGKGGLKVVVFDHFQRYVICNCKKLMKKCYNSFIFYFNDLKSTGSVKSDRNNTTVSSFCLLLVIYYGFWPKMGQNRYCSIILA